ncbi:hypothetical protein PR202_ga23956 [Eleusine coracana subsp. coracana]|uniref:Uncharacterized protein n=1 Tax=Eleusine coracana subsp. coracana TaxID=191504 RepID=A0AAV5D7N6_ELECO|nr:hypothetical protein PR202_ga23956 [Eleusine coracana subsp. coracana]
MAKKPIQYAVVDAFAAEPFKGNPAAVCLLEDAAKATDDRWLQAVAAEFNLSETAYLLRDASDGATPRFQLRWFTPAAERAPAPPFQVELCGHATLASAHFLFTSVLAEHDAVVEFATKSGILTAKKVLAPDGAGVSCEGKLFIELDFPMIDVFECDNAELLYIPKTLNGASVVSVHKSSTVGDLVDPVCGSAHCVLAPYWGGKLGKQKLTAFQASPRSGVLYLELEAAARRVRIQGEAVTVMSGTLLA